MSKIPSVAVREREQEIVHRFYVRNKDISDIAEALSVDFFEVLKVLRPYMESDEKKDYSKVRSLWL